jgi:putative ABC transport system substrate-binding protein
MQRREFITLIGGAAVLPRAAAVKQPDRVRRLGIIIGVGKTPEYVAALAAFEQVLGSLGWKQGDNLRIDDRWSAGGSRERAFRRYGHRSVQPGRHPRTVRRGG